MFDSKREMKPDDARKLDHTTLEEMRIRAVRSVQAGESPEVVARLMRINRRTIYGWLAQYRRGGWGALESQAGTSPPPKAIFPRPFMSSATGADMRPASIATCKNPFGSQAYAAEELIAELTSAFLCAHLAVNGELRHASYIDNWLALLKEDNRAIFTAALHCGALRHRLMQ